MKTPLYKSSLLILVALFLVSKSYSQAGILYNSENVQDGYVLVSHDFSTYLLDQCGEIVNEWSIFNPQFHVKMDTEGNVYYIRQGKIFVRDWQDNIIQEITHNVTGLELVYDIIKRDNGNFLVNCRWSTSFSDLEDIGWDLNIGFANQVDGIVEINPEGELVWAWNIMDHTIQDKIQSAPNFGSVTDNPQLLDSRAVSNFDWTFGETFMFNGFDYNKELDLIMISVRKMSEIIIIDHSTTTEEAAGHSGGKYGKGGDVLFRWGNPRNYNRNSSSERYLYFQHNPNWIKHGEHAGGIIVFNNGLSSSDGSSVIIIEPQTDENDQFVMSDDHFQPILPSREIDNSSFANLSSEYTSGAKVMENGNVYITLGQHDQFIEVTPDDEIAWNYALQGTHYTYRTEKYPSTYPGLIDKDLTPNGTIENIPFGYDCTLYTVSTEEVVPTGLDFGVVQEQGNLHILPSFEGLYQIRLSDLSGRSIFHLQDKTNQQTIDITNLENQLIFITIIDKKGRIGSKKTWVR